MVKVPMSEKVAGIIPAAGSGTRFGAEIPKQFIEVKGKPVLAWTVDALLQSAILKKIVIVLPASGFDHWKRYLTSFVNAPGVEFVPGGKERWESVWNGLKVVCNNFNLVLIHDGARPLVKRDLVIRAVEKARKKGAAICAVPATDTVKNVKGEMICVTLDRNTIWLAQTPQVFKTDLLMEAYERAIEASSFGTDDASLVEKIGYRVFIVPGDRSNIKITTQEDLEWFQWAINRK